MRLAVRASASPSSERFGETAAARIFAGIALSAQPEALTGSSAQIMVGMVLTVQPLLVRQIDTKVRVLATAESQAVVRTGIQLTATAAVSDFGFNRDLVLARQDDLPAESLTDFVLIGQSLSDATLKDVANGGHVTSSSAAVSPPSGWQSFTPLNVSAGGSFLLRNDTDYLVANQSSTNGVRLRGGRRVVVMGLTVTIDRPSDWTTAGSSVTCGIYLDENDLTAPADGGPPLSDRAFYCEGLLLKGSTLTQGVFVYCATADVTLVNVHVAGVRFDSCDHRDGTNGKTLCHPDLLETKRGCKSLVIDGFTGYSNYQGLFFKEEQVTVGGPISLRRIDVHAIEHVGSDGINYPGGRMIWNRDNQMLTLGDDVWCDGLPRNFFQPGSPDPAGYRQRYFNGTAYVLEPSPSGANDALAFEPDLVSFGSDEKGSFGLGTGNISGTCYLGSPPVEFVPSALVGQGYAYPNDLKFTDAAISQLSHNIVTYSPTTGEVFYDLKLPSWQVASADVLFRLFYGNDGISQPLENAAGCFSRTAAVWAWPSGDDISGHGRGLMASGIASGTLKGPAGVFEAADFARLTEPLFAAVTNCAVEFWIRPTATGRVLRIGPTGEASSPALDVRLDAAGWACTKRTAAGSQISSSSAAVTLAQDYHVVVVFRDGLDSLIYVNGEPLALTQGTARAGAIAVLPTDELAIGDPTPADRVGFAGTLGRVIFWAFAPSATWIKASYRIQADQAAYLGLSAENLAGVADRGPVAVPTKASVIVGSSVDVDVAVRAFDPNSDLLAASVPSPPTQGTSSIVANKVRYTPQGGTGGQTHTVPFRVADAAKSSDGIIRVSVAALPVSGYRETPNNRVISSGGDLGQKLANELAAAVPNLTIWCPPGDYTNPNTNEWSFNLNTGLTTSTPLIIRPIDDAWLSCRFMQRVVFRGKSTTIAGFEVADGIAGRIVEIKKEFCRWSRGKINYTGTSAAAGVVIYELADDVEVDRNDIRIWKGGSGKTDGRCIGLDGGDPTNFNNTARRPVIEFNYLHGCNGRQGEGVNFHEAIQIGRGANSSQIEVNAIVRFNLLDACTNDSEAVSAKSRGGLYENIILKNGNNGARLSNRMGTNNIWRACRAETGGIITGDKDIQLIGCEVTGSAFIEIKAGNITAAAFATNQSGNNQVAATDTILDHCSGEVQVGPVGSGDVAPALRTTIRSHVGTIRSTPPGNGANQFFWSTLTTGGTAPGSKPTIVALTPGVGGNVGPFAP